MMILYLLIVIFYLFLIICARHESVDTSALKSRLQEPFIKAAAFLYKRKIRWMKPKRGGRHCITDDLKILYPTAAIAVKETEYHIQKMSLVLIVILAGDLLALCLCINSRTAENGQTGMMQRGIYGAGDRAVTLQAAVETEEETVYEEFRITVSEREYTREEALKKLEEAIARLPEEILGENKSLNEVTSDLNFVTELSGSPVTIRWESGDYRMLDQHGTIMITEPSKEGELCQVTAYAAYHEYEQAYTFYVRLCPTPKAYNEILREELLKAVGEQEEKDRTAESWELPQEVAGSRVSWAISKKDNSVTILILALLFGIICYFVVDRDLHKRVTQRRTELLREYPEMISKFTLLMSAGMTVRMIFYKLSEDYRKTQHTGRQSSDQVWSAQVKGRHKPEKGKHRIETGKYGMTETEKGKDARKKRNVKKRNEKTGNEQKRDRKAAVYKEIMLTCLEMESGVSELQAYVNFGKRCGEQRYIKFSTLLTQNVRKGTAGLMEIMKHEAQETLAERKSEARRLGEEAGTKLLMPMMLMLVIVMIMIMVPAFLSFSI